MIIIIYYSFCMCKRNNLSNSLQVVAGLSRHIEVQVFAMAIGSTSHDQVGSLYHELMVTTETSILYLPIKACIQSNTCALIIFLCIVTDP